jgi:hypothetical protein
MTGPFPEDSAARKTYPVYSGLLQYFPSALAAVAHHSYIGNEKHNPGLPLHWARGKSGDEADALLRHLMERDYVGVAWRALALLQKHLEANGAPIAPGARIPVEPGLASLPLTPVTEAEAAAIKRDLLRGEPDRDDDEGSPGEQPRNCS